MSSLCKQWPSCSCINLKYIKNRDAYLNSTKTVKRHSTFSRMVRQGRRGWPRAAMVSVISRHRTDSGTAIMPRGEWDSNESKQALEDRSLPLETIKGVELFENFDIDQNFRRQRRRSRHCPLICTSYSPKDEGTKVYLYIQQVNFLCSYCHEGQYKL